MSVLVQAHDVKDNLDLYRLTYQLRKKVFADQLKWDVTTGADLEFDDYDNEDAHYLIWCSEDRKVLFGHVRLTATAVLA